MLLYLSSVWFVAITKGCVKGIRKAFQAPSRVAKDDLGPGAWPLGVSVLRLNETRLSERRCVRRSERCVYAFAVVACR